MFVCIVIHKNHPLSGIIRWKCNFQCIFKAPPWIRLFYCYLIDCFKLLAYFLIYWSNCYSSSLTWFIKGTAVQFQFNFALHLDYGYLNFEKKMYNVCMFSFCFSAGYEDFVVCCFLVFDTFFNCFYFVLHYLFYIVSISLSFFSIFFFVNDRLQLYLMCVFFLTEIDNSIHKSINYDIDLVTL